MTTTTRGLAALLAAFLLAGAAGAACADDPMTTAKALNAQGLALIEQKRFDEAEKPLLAAMALCDGPLHGEHYCVAGVGENLAAIAEHRGDLAAAERLLNRAIAVTKAALGDQGYQYGKLQAKLGRVLLAQHRFDPAKTALEIGLGAFWNAGDAPNSWVATSDIATVYRMTGRPELAGALLEKAVVICQSAGPECEAARIAMLGEIHWSIGHPEQGEAYLRQSAELWGAAGEADAQRDVLIVLAGNLVQLGDYGKAEDLTQARYEAVRGGAREPVQIASAEAALAEIYLATGRTTLADSMIASATARLTADAGHGDAYGDTLMELGKVQISAHRLAEARTFLERSLATPSQVTQGVPRWKALAEAALGEVASQEKRPAEAEDHYRKAAQDFQDVGDINGHLFAEVNLGETYAQEGRLEEAEIVLKGAVAQAKARLTPDALTVGVGEAALARLSNTSERYAEAEAYAADALAKLRLLSRPPTWQLAESLLALGIAEAHVGHMESGVEHARQAVKLYRDQNPISADDVARSQSVLCEILDVEGHATAAEGCKAKPPGEGPAP